MHHYDGWNPQQRADGITHALAAIRRGELVVVNLDSTYAVITDAFSDIGVGRIRAMKQRDRMNVPVLVPRPDTVQGLAQFAGDSALVARDLMRDCWPGPLAIVARVQPSLAWSCTPDGTVALRMPMHPWTLELLRAIGPTAYAPTHGPDESPHIDISEVEAAIGGHTQVFLNGGRLLPDQLPTIVDLTGEQPRIVREGAFSRTYLEGLGVHVE